VLEVEAREFTDLLDEITGFQRRPFKICASAQDIDKECIRIRLEGCVMNFLKPGTGIPEVCSPGIRPSLQIDFEGSRP